MSDTGQDNSGGVVPVQQPQPKAQLPDAVSIGTDGQGNGPTPPVTQKATPGPGNTGAGLNTPTQGNASGANGGNATFNPATQSIMDMVNAQAAYVNSSITSMKANQAIDSTTAKAVSGITDDTLDAYSNIQKADSLPGGRGGDIATILGLFNSKYDAQVQQDRIQMNTVKSSQVANTAAVLKEQNNIIPQIAEKNFALNKQIFDAQNDVNKLVLQGQQLDLDKYKTRIDVARLGLEQSAEQRNRTNFQVQSMSTGQLEAYLQKQPNGPIAGFVQHRLTEEQQAVTNLGIAGNALQKGNIQTFNDSMTDAASHMPQSYLQTQIAAAQQKGMPYIEVPMGGKTVQMPVDLAQAGLAKSIDVDNQVNQQLAAQEVQRSNLMPNIQTLTTSLAALSPLDSRATAQLTTLGATLKNFDGRNPAQVRQMATIVQGMMATRDQIAADHAKTMTTKEGQAGVELFGKTGKFDVTGGQAVMADSAGIGGLMKSGRYGAMWNTFGVGVAQKLVSQGIVNSVNSPNGSADAAAVIAAALAKPNGKQTVSAAAQAYLADPNKAKPLQDAISDKIQSSSLDDVIGQLANQKGSDPLWQHMAQNRQLYEGPDGKLDVQKLFDAMEQGTVTNHVNGKQADLTQMLLRGMRAYGANADEASSADPTYTMYDHAAEAALFGGNPAGNVLHDLTGQLTVKAMRARQTMMQRINSDVTGKTQQDAVMRADPLFEPQPGLTFDNPVAIKKHTGVDMNLVPSATGTGLTAAQVKAAYPSGLQ